MSIRTTARSWLASKNITPRGLLRSSKFYRPEESWPKKEVWWIQFPVKALTEHSEIDMLCQKSPGSNDFYFLKVPSTFLTENIGGFDKVYDTVHLYLDASQSNLFAEIRGKKAVSFRRFVTNPDKANSD